MRKGLWSIFVVLFFLPMPSLAFDIGQMQINGFLSQGYLDSSGNNFLTADSVDGTNKFNEVGLAVNTQLSDRLRAGLQLLSRDLGDVGNNDVRLDWGFADYRYRDYLGVRIGKVKLPMGLYNEGRDTDMLRPMVFLPQSIYDETKRDFLVSYQGAGIYGNLSLGNLGDLDYHGFYGGINIDEESLLLRALQQSAKTTTMSTSGQSYVPIEAASLMPAAMADAVAANGGPLTPEQTQAVQASVQAEAKEAVLGNIYVPALGIDNDHISGLSLIYNTPLAGLRFGMSYLEVENSIDYTVLNYNAEIYDGEVTTQPARFSGVLENESTYVASLEYVHNNLLFAGEYGETERVQSFDGVTAIDATAQSWYVMAAYTFLDRLTVSALYDEYYSDKDDKDGKAFASVNPGRKDFFAWRKDLGLGVRYDISENWLVKAEFHDVNGAALFLTTLNDPADLEEDWNYFVVKTSVNF